jgi:hypothetical protein
MVALVESVFAWPTAQGKLPPIATLPLLFVTSQLLGVTRFSSTSIRG